MKKKNAWPFIFACCLTRMRHREAVSSWKSKMGSAKEVSQSVVFCLCGPVGSLCCFILSIWGVLMLVSHLTVLRSTVCYIDSTKAYSYYSVQQCHKLSFCVNIHKIDPTCISRVHSVEGELIKLSHSIIMCTARKVFLKSWRLFSFTDLYSSTATRTNLPWPYVTGHDSVAISNTRHHVATPCHYWEVTIVLHSLNAAYYALSSKFTIDSCCYFTTYRVYLEHSTTLSLLFYLKTSMREYHTAMKTEDSMVSTTTKDQMLHWHIATWLSKSLYAIQCTKWSTCNRNMVIATNLEK